MSTRGKFIVIEGVDGCGKTTAIAHVQKALAGKDVIFTREPGGTSVGEQIRAILLKEKVDPRTELELFFASRMEHVAALILPCLERGTHVISDRFSASTFAYQIYARGRMEHLEMFTLRDQEIAQLVVPDLYILLDVPTEIAMGRMRMGRRASDLTKFDKERAEFHRAVREGYRQFLSSVPRSVVIDASPPEGIVGAAVLRAVEETLVS